MAPTKAAVKVVTVKPRMKVPKYQKSSPLTTSEKSPRVTTLIGRVRILITGLMNILNNVKHAPTIKDTQIGSTVIPEITNVVTHTATESTIQCKIILIIKLLSE